MSNSEKIKGAYKTSKNIYDDALAQKKWWSKLYISLFWGGIDDFKLAQNVLNAIPADFNGRLLDVPVGTALFTVDKYLSLPNVEITCLDYSEDMLEQAKFRFTENKIKNITCIQGDVGNLPFEDETFDVVLSMNGFHAFPDKDKAFSETARVLKTGALFCGCFYIKNENKRTDFLVNFLFSKKGWFTPPFYTSDELKTELSKYYSKTEVENEQSMVKFKCFK